jgi:hypothetical protein
MSEDNTGILEIIRPSMYFAKYRSYPIFVDGEKVGSVKDSAALAVQLQPGSHNVWSKIDWKKSNTAEIRIEAGNTARIKVGYKKKEGLRLLLPVVLGFVAIIFGATLGIVLLSVFGFFGILMARVGDLYIEEEIST